MSLRARRIPPIVIGLTGSVGMGKSTAAGMLRRMGLPLHDADAAVHRLLAQGGAAVKPVKAAFSGVTWRGAIDRKKLGARVFENAEALRRLEAILHPLVRHSARRFLKIAARQRRRLAVLDIPLLFETGGEAMCDAVIVVSAPEFVQRARVLARPGMTAARFRAIRAKQMPDRLKRRRADFVVKTGLSRRETLRQLRVVVRLLRASPRRRPRRRAWPLQGPARRRCPGRHA
ncbi:MAG: dephospho-CoA kinase [Kiloniellaceae bacterium]